MSKTSSTILIVDDDAFGRKALEGPLSKQNYQLVFANDGEEALQQATRYLPDLILLDVMMPKMDGFETCRHIRANPMLAEIPVLMITSLDDQESRLQGIEAGADDFITKPFNRALLRAKVNTITRLNRYRKLLLEKNRFEWAVDQADEGYLIITPDDQIVFTNHLARIYLGIPSGEEEYKDTFLNLAQQQYQCHPEVNWDNWPPSSEKNANQERYLILPETEEHSPVWLQIETLIQENDPTANRLLRILDITRSIEIQRNIRSFHSILSHNLRSSINTSRVTLNLLSQSNFGNPETVELTNLTSQGIKQLKNQIKQYIEYLKTNNFSSATPPLDIATVKDLLLQISEKINNSNIQININNDFLHKAKIQIPVFAIENIFWEITKALQSISQNDPLHISVNIMSIPQNMVRLQFIVKQTNLQSNILSQAWMLDINNQKTAYDFNIPLTTIFIWQIGGTTRVYTQQSQTSTIIELDIPLKG